MMTDLSSQESGTPGVLPMDMEVWAEQLLQRVLGAIAALDAPDNRASDQASASGGGGHGGVSFLLQSMFRCHMHCRHTCTAVMSARLRHKHGYHECTTDTITGSWTCQFQTTRRLNSETESPSVSQKLGLETSDTLSGSTRSARKGV